MVRLFSAAGGIVFMGSLRPGARYELTTREGDVRLVLRRTPFSVSARAPSGAVKSAFAVGGVHGPARLAGDFLGGGPSLELTSYKGNVLIDAQR
jgi:hypothetical protein